MYTEGMKVKVIRVPICSGTFHQEDIGTICTITFVFPASELYILDDNRFQANFKETDIEPAGKLDWNKLIKGQNEKN